MTIWWIDWQQGGQEGGATGDKVLNIRTNARAFASWRSRSRY